MQISASNVSRETFCILILQQTSALVYCTHYQIERMMFMKKSNSLLTTTAAAFGILHCINKFIDSNSVSGISNHVKGEYYKWTHGNIYYTVCGHGKPLLLIHDLTVFSSGYEWKEVVRQLSADYTIYTVDLIGCGRSDKPSLTYTNYLYVQLVSDFVKNVIGRKTSVAATGLSSSFVLMANHMDKTLFSNLMLVSPENISVLKKMPGTNSHILLKLFELPVIGKTAYYIASNKTNTEYYLNQKCFFDSSKIKPGIFKAYYDAAHTSQGNGKALLASLEGKYLHVDISKALEYAENDIVVINGIHDESRQSVHTSYQAVNPHLIFETVSNSKALPQLENPEEMLKLVYTYL